MNNKYVKTFENFSLNNDIKMFLSNKEFINPKSKMFLFHGTKVKPEKFILTDKYDGEDSNVWFSDLPQGYLFLTTDVEEAFHTGHLTDKTWNYVIPCELKKFDHIFFEVKSNNPSQVFDDDYGISYNNKTNFGFWEQFEESGKSALIIKGFNKKWTIITSVENIIPRTDLAIEFYHIKNGV